MAGIRGYNIFYGTDGYDRPYARISVDSTTETRYAAIPTLEEASAFLNETIDYIGLSSCFASCSNMLASPSISAPYYSGHDVYSDCTSLLIAPTLFRPLAGITTSIEDTFENCTALIQAAVIPNGEQALNWLYNGCSALPAPVSITPSVGSIAHIYQNCTNLEGEFVVRRNRTSGITDALKGTTKPLVIYGDQTTCEAIAATANNGNATWSPWYDPVPAVTDRGPDSYTTAADMTRIVRNGALAVDTFAPGRMVYQQGDIVREDEWNAIVEAAQTIDPTVTYSTHYANLNKIEAAFDSAL